MEEPPPKKSALRLVIGRIAMLITAIILAGAVWLLLPAPSAPPAPVYQGKTMYDWLYNVRPTNQALAMEAFKQMGATAVPFLVRELERKDSAWDKFCQWTYAKLPTEITRHLPEHRKQIIRWNNASFGLVSTRSKAAIPPLLRMLSEEDTTRQAEALSALQFIVQPSDTNCVPQLTVCFHSQEPAVCLLSAGILDRISPWTLTIPPLTNLVDSTNAWARVQSLELLQRHDPTNSQKWRRMLTNESLWKNSHRGSR